MQALRGENVLLLHRPQELNKYGRGGVAFPTIFHMEKKFLEMTDGSIFSTLNISVKSWQVPLYNNADICVCSPPSLEDTVFSETHLSVYSTRGASPATVIKCWKGNKLHRDEVLIRAKPEDHDQRGLATLERTSKAGQTRNKQKCKFCQMEKLTLAKSLNGEIYKEINAAALRNYLRVLDC